MDNNKLKIKSRDNWFSRIKTDHESRKRVWGRESFFWWRADRNCSWNLGKQIQKTKSWYRISSEIYQSKLGGKAGFDR